MEDAFLKITEYLGTFNLNVGIVTKACNCYLYKLPKKCFFLLSADKKYQQYLSIFVPDFGDGGNDCIYIAPL